MSEKKTGQRRYRRGLFGRLILQIEVTTTYSRTEPVSCDVEKWSETSWRDAKVEDLTAHELAYGTGMV